MSIAYEPRPAAELRTSVRGEPTWELALRHPRQGDWTEQDYLGLEQQGVLIELVDGCLEFLPMPTLRHQRIVKYVAWLLDQYLKQQGMPGEIGMAPCPVRLWPGRVREPDVFYLLPEHLAGPDEMPTGLALAVEVVSDGGESRKRDLVDKRADYARAGVKESWIVDPESSTVSVLALVGESYVVHGEFVAGTAATSRLFPGLAVAVDDVFRVGRG
ncbi:MAG: Uma2 family endonuclease [Planctomycetaceae bacterium]|nr:Uma2 family endonuclease [Planctomycetaceae bacterium]